MRNKNKIKTIMYFFTRNTLIGCYFLPIERLTNQGLGHLTLTLVTDNLTVPNKDGYHCPNRSAVRANY